MKRFRLLTMILIVVYFAFSACDDGDGSTPVTYAIGEPGPSGVGIVFYVTDGGLHGLEVAPADQSTGTVWSNIDSILIGTTGIAIGTGYSNTDAIIGQSGHSVSAAQICRKYREDEEGDWFLPSQDELNAIWDNLVDDGTGSNSGTGGFALAIYWTSSEYDLSSAYFQRFDNGIPAFNDKDIPDYKVRAVRAF